ncbi:hypothetical protein [Microcoleus sp. D3_18a_C4]|uniref:hypothetical protein n=1 Tax=Microcoleus sp. D3_18a_C4 TaxID=3055332 RepID=UPI002FCFB201
MQLQEIQQLLRSEKFTTSLKPADENIPIDQLFVALNGEEAEYVLELVYVPNLENQLENVKLLQFFVRLPCEVELSATEEIKNLVLHLNVNTPLMGWGFQEDLELLYFRHILVVPNLSGANTQTVITQTVWLIFYLLETFYPVIASIATGEKSFEELQDTV